VEEHDCGASTDSSTKAVGDWRAIRGKILKFFNVNQNVMIRGGIGVARVMVLWK
jgi:hypothetical protein